MRGVTQQAWSVTLCIVVRQKTQQSKAIRRQVKTANYCRSMALANTNSSRANSNRHLLVKVPIWNDVIGIALAGSICIPTDNSFGIFGEKKSEKGKMNNSYS